MSKTTGNLKDRYNNEVRAKLKEEFAYKTICKFLKWLKSF